jgi:hypothetical protein
MAEKVVIKDYKFQNLSFSGSDMIATCNIRSFDGKYNKTYSLGSLQTLSYSIHMQRHPVRSISNVNAKDYVMGPRTIAGSLVFAVFNKHFANELMSNIETGLKPTAAFLADELPPFDITISMANEYGVQARMVIYGVRLVNEGQVMSVNDIYTENTYQFVATDLESLTDQDGYSSYNQLKNKSYIGITEEELNNTSAKQIFNTATPAKEEVIDLIATVVDNATQTKKGTVKFKIVPGQTTGIIQVQNLTSNESLSIQVDDQPMSTMFISFAAGVYTAQYIDQVKGKSSSVKSFTVAEVYSQGVERFSIPLIDNVTHNSISVYANGFGHTTVKYAEWLNNGDMEYIALPLVNKRSTITGLTPYTRYLVYTCDDTDTKKSQPVTVSTLLFNDQPYDNLRSFVDFNRYKFKNGQLIEYMTIVNEAKVLAERISITIKVSEAIALLKTKYQKQLSELRVENFPSTELYLDEFNRLQRIGLICYDLIIYADKIMNDIIYSNNLSAIVVQPAPEILSFANSVILISKDTVELDIYIINNDKTQLLIKVPKSKFTVYDSERLSYRFTGKPCTKYFAYAIDAKSIKSPRFDFYVPSDADKTSTLEIYAAATKRVDTYVEQVKSSLLSDFDKYHMSEPTKDRVVMEQIKIVETELLKMPVVTSSSPSKIVVDVNNKEILSDTIQEFYVAISSAVDALYENPSYKIAIDKNTLDVEFTTELHGIKGNKNYVIWIENSNGTQVSRSTTASTFAAPDDYSIESYNIAKELEQIEKLLKDKIIVSSDIKSILESSGSDDTVNFNNIFDIIIKNVFEFVPELNNSSSVIRAIMEVNADLRHETKRMFFTSPVVYSKEYKTLLMPENKKAMIKFIYPNGTIQSTSNSGNPIDINGQHKYVIVYFVEDDLRTKSGMILINLLTAEAYGYQIGMEVI